MMNTLLKAQAVLNLLVEKREEAVPAVGMKR
jgi:hypothetical protein